MEKTATLNLRVNPAVKERTEAVLSRLGVPMPTDQRSLFCSLGVGILS